MAERAHDVLTGLASRLVLDEQMDQALVRLARHGEGFVLHRLALERTAPVSDALGPTAGDTLLKAVAQRLRHAIRGTELVARLSDSEFAILQTAVKDHHDAARFASRLLQAIAAPYDLGGRQLIIAARIGMACAPRDGEDADMLLHRAGLALQRAASTGHHRFCLFEPQIDDEVQDRYALEAEVAGALSRGELVLCFAPWIDLATGRVGGCEARPRWMHPQRGVIEAGTFMPLAEASGLAGPIGEWMLQQACATVANWPPEIRVAIDLTAAQLVTGQAVHHVRAALAASGLAADRLELEIAEGLLAHPGSGPAFAVLTALHQLGVAVALDDFGTGSSLNYLRAFPFDRVKIDASFVAELTASLDGQAIIAAVSGLGRHLGIATTALGVASEEQLLALRAAGCTDAQGPLFAEAQSADGVLALLRTSFAEATRAA
jgi:diguanylate cyclase (GGDEF)-like protein